jgi:hypothetical protein
MRDFETSESKTPNDATRSFGVISLYKLKQRVNVVP